LWSQGKADAAFHQEQIWNELARNYDIDVQCWSVTGEHDRKENEATFEEICARHSVVHAG